MTRIAALLATLLAPCLALAQAYPAKPVKIVVAFTAGGTTDIMARLLAQGLSDRLKQPFVIENKPGAGGNLGTEIVCRAPPDGYTLGINSVGPISVNPTLYKSLACNPHHRAGAGGAHFRSAERARGPPVAQGLDARSVRRVREGATRRAQLRLHRHRHVVAPFQLHARFARRLHATHIPYKGAEALKDLLTGRVQFMFATIPSVIAHIRAGNLVAIGVSSLKRSRSLPDVPTIAESGFPGFEAGSWFGIFAPKGTPAAVIATLNKAVERDHRRAPIESRMIDEGATRPAAPRRGSANSCGANTKNGAR
jgi:tripartite-type tricarboxylate transporter receptor subunit TctC